MLRILSLCFLSIAKNLIPYLIEKAGCIALSSIIWYYVKWFFKYLEMAAVF